MKKYLVYMTQSELFKVEVEAKDKKDAEDKASQAFSNGEYTETGSCEVNVDSVEEITD
jgi:hypothetical protein